MGRQARIVASLLVLAYASSGASATRKFNINDDLLAFPQYQINFPDSFILDSQARAYLEQAPHSSSSTAHKRDTSGQAPLKDKTHDTTHDESEKQVKLSYEELILEDQRYLCQVPLVEDSDANRTQAREANEEEERKELARATDRGLELLREMEGRCLYYLSGWWSYSFCYMNQIKQFHALPSGGGVPSYPPMEDHTTHSFILGRFPREDGQYDDEGETKPGKTTTDLAELQTKGGSRYLVQHLEGGDQCDLTGKNRKIEVQFHCNPQSTDRIGWIKELTTCSYLMLVYTPRLCNDVAFLPPQQEEVHTIECRKILTAEEVSGWQAMQEYHLSQKLVESAETPDYPVIGGIIVGAQLLVGTEGRHIEKGRVASIGEEKVDAIAKIVDGEVQLLSREGLKKFELDPEKLESLKKKLEDWAEGKDWTLEMVTRDGERTFLRGVIDEEVEEEEEEKEEGAGKPKEGEENKSPGRQEEKVLDKERKGGNGEKEPTLEKDSDGSQEVFKDEL
ncbi:glucosidase II beta subunit-like protein-domain-containing protein [Aspergillus cavernicola]|uniref:Endoplasmic reticulum lectin n=1 Tax=Aspergillus cavernicola TaxID=176166 RepID=A0ABR4I9Q6_9EURO